MTSCFRKVNWHFLSFISTYRFSKLLISRSNSPFVYQAKRNKAVAASVQCSRDCLLFINVQLMTRNTFFGIWRRFITSRFFEITKWCQLGQGPQTNVILSYTCENLIKYSVFFSLFAINRAVCLTVTHAASFWRYEVRTRLSCLLAKVSYCLFISSCYIQKTVHYRFTICKFLART